MKHAVFTDEDNSEFPIAVLTNRIVKDGIRKEYIETFGMDPSSVVAVETPRPPEGKKKTPKKEMVEYVKETLIPNLNQVQTKYILCSDSEYFKVLTDLPQAANNLGYVVDCKYGPQKVAYLPSTRSVFYDPEKVRGEIQQAIDAVIAHYSGSYVDPGSDILKSAAYPKTDKEIEEWLEKLLEMNVPLSIDTEAFSLKHYEAGLGSISFAWSKTEGIAFLVDYVPTGSDTAPFGKQVRNQHRRELLRNFFIRYRQKAVYHNISFDATLLIYQLFMENLTDTTGMLQGMGLLLDNWDDTKLITYLATNSCAGNELGLKKQAQEYAGNYAESDIDDITKIKPDDLLKYNLVDSCSTWFVHEKHYDTMVADNQKDFYDRIFRPAILDIVQMQLTGMPLDKNRVVEVEGLLQKDADAALAVIKASPIVKAYNYKLCKDWVEKRNSELKVKRVSLLDAKEEFNPASPLQMQELLYEIIGLPILDLTESKQPATGKKVLEKLLNHANKYEEEDLIVELLKALIDYKNVIKILESFIPAMLAAPQGPDGWHYLMGNFNLGGTVSGRLSSNNPNLQNLPAGSKYAKLIKSCFKAPPGYIFIGLDFASLEDRISALTTKDPNKLKVYTDGFDGHAMRAVAYWPHLMPDINPNDVNSVNQVAEKGHKYEKLRGKSKAPTFAMTYQGTWLTLVKNCGFPEKEAKEVEERFRTLYKVSIDWVSQKLDEASKCGYITGAFGLRVRTPLLHQVVRGTKKTPSEAEAEGRTAGNALGQSWCLLNSRAASEFMGKARKSQHRTHIRPCAQIHDASYYLIPDDLDVLMYVNEHLVKAVQWQDHPDIAHPEVGLGGEVSIFYPSWEKEIVIPNGATQEEVLNIIAEKTSEPNPA